MANREGVAREARGRSRVEWTHEERGRLLAEAARLVKETPGMNLTKALHAAQVILPVKRRRKVNSTRSKYYNWYLDGLVRELAASSAGHDVAVPLGMPRELLGAKPEYLMIGLLYNLAAGMSSVEGKVIDLESAVRKLGKDAERSPAFRAIKTAGPPRIPLAGRKRRGGPVPSNGSIHDN
jgi:hypothetical protein